VPGRRSASCPSSGRVRPVRYLRSRHCDFLSLPGFFLGSCARLSLAACGVSVPNCPVNLCSDGIVYCSVNGFLAVLMCQFGHKILDLGYVGVVEPENLYWHFLVLMPIFPDLAYDRWTTLFFVLAIWARVCCELNSVAL
jgi:hypothetical protein